MRPRSRWSVLFAALALLSACEGSHPGSGAAGADGGIRRGSTGVGGMASGGSAAGVGGMTTGGGGPTGSGGMATGGGGPGGGAGGIATGGRAPGSGGVGTATGGRAPGSGGESGRTGSGGRATGGSGAGGGTGAMGGGAGSEGDPPRCVPGQSVACACRDGRAGAQVCETDGTFDACTCTYSELERIERGMVGTWIGTDSNPWTTSYQVKIVFTADGLYSAHCAESACPAPVFYYGIDDDSPLKTYELRDLRADEAATGRLTTIFSLSETDPSYLTLDTVFISADGQRLSLEVWSDTHGPIRLDLKRAS